MADNILRAGNAYEFDNIDGRADISTPMRRLSVAQAVMRRQRPWNMQEEKYQAAIAWAQATINGKTDELPPFSVNQFVSCRWPWEAAQTNGQRAEENSQ